MALVSKKADKCYQTWLRSQSDVDRVYRLMHKDPELRSVTAFSGKDLIVRLTRKHKYSNKSRFNCFVLSVGVPNYLEAARIKAGKNLIGSIWARTWPEKKKKAT